MMKMHEYVGIKKMPRGKMVMFEFNGNRLFGHEGEPICVTLVTEERIHSCLEDRPCNSFCKVGDCRKCAMLVDGEVQHYTCLKPIREGMVVKTMCSC